MVTENPSYASNLTQEQSGQRFVIRDSDEALVGERRLGGARSYVAWGAVIAGALAALAILALFSAFAYAVDIPAYRGGPFGWGAGIWCVFSAIVAFFIGGFMVSYFTPRFEMRYGLLHGAMAWVLGTVLVLTLSAGVAGMFRGLLIANAYGMGLLPLNGTITHDQIVGAGWAAFIAMACGLIFACIGGMAGYTVDLRTMKSLHA